MSCSVVFVHLGPSIPDHAAVAIRQAALFSSGAVYLVANAEALCRFSRPDVARLTVVAAEDLGNSALHQRFKSVCPFDMTFRDGFWTYTTERFFHLLQLIDRFGLTDVVHLENDVMLYADLDILGPALSTVYKGMAAPFNFDDFCIPSIVYIKNRHALNALCEFIIRTIEDRPDKELNDMVLLSKAHYALGDSVLSALPIVPSFYPFPLVNRNRLTTADPALFRSHANRLGMIFDANAIGQYLAGPDPRNFEAKKRRWHHVFRKSRRIPPGPGFVNRNSVLDPARLTYDWSHDEAGRRILTARLGGHSVRVANLHVHSKNLGEFA